MVTIVSINSSGNGDRTRARWHAVEMHRAGAALRNPAAIFCAGEMEFVAEHPKQGRIAVLDFELMGLAVNAELAVHCRFPGREQKR